MCLTNKTSEHSHSLKHHVQPPFVSKLPQVSCLEEKMESHLLAFTLPRLGIGGFQDPLYIAAASPAGHENVGTMENPLLQPSSQHTESQKARNTWL